jgi:hypothetical protein
MVREAEKSQDLVSKMETQESNNTNLRIQKQPVFPICIQN